MHRSRILSRIIRAYREPICRRHNRDYRACKIYTYRPSVTGLRQCCLEASLRIRGGEIWVRGTKKLGFSLLTEGPNNLVAESHDSGTQTMMTSRPRKAREEDFHQRNSLLQMIVMCWCDIVGSCKARCEWMQLRCCYVLSCRIKSHECSRLSLSPDLSIIIS